jgi:hypothetical protein
LIGYGPFALSDFSFQISEGNILSGLTVDADHSAYSRMKMDCRHHYDRGQNIWGLQIWNVWICREWIGITAGRYAQGRLVIISPPWSLSEAWNEYIEVDWWIIQLSVVSPTKCNRMASLSRQRKQSARRPLLEFDPLRYSAKYEIVDIRISDLRSIGARWLLQVPGKSASVRCADAPFEESHTICPPVKGGPSWYRVAEK